MYIYKILNKITGRVYIGQTSTLPRKRKNKHYSQLRKNSHKNTWLQNSWNKHGEENFDFEVLECILNKDKNYLAEREVYYINNIENTYNLLLAQQTHYPKCVLKAKCCPIHIGHNKIWKGRKHREESKKKMATAASKRVGGLNSFYGKSHTEKTKELLSKAASKRTGRKNSFYNKNHSKETKEKLSIAAKERFTNYEKHPFYNSQEYTFYNSSENKKVTMTCHNFYLYLKELTGSASKGNISSLKSGKIKSYKGYRLNE